MGMASYNPFMGQTIKTNGKTPTDRVFLAHYQLTAAQAVAADDDYLKADALTTLAVQNFAGPYLNEILAPRVLSITADTANMAGNVVITGTDANDEALTNNIALNGAAAVNGTRAFKTVTNIQYPAARLQSGSATVTTAADTQSGNVTATVTAAVIGGAQTTGNIAVLDSDTKADIATKIAAAIDADATIGADFDCVADGEDIVLTAKVPAANDATYDLTVADTGLTGVVVGAYADVVTGIPAGNIRVGISDLFGIPYKLPYSTVMAMYANGVADVVAASAWSETVLAGNYIDPTIALAGAQVDVYLVV